MSLRTKRLLRLLAATVLLAVGFEGLVIGLMFPRTRHAEGFSTAGFEALHPGDTEAEVVRRLGHPLESYSHESVERWCFEAPTRLGWRQPDECLFIEQGIVVSVRSVGDSPLSPLQGQTAAEAERRLGRPKYILPPGKTWVLRYSSPRGVSDNYEAHEVLLDGERIVRGTDSYLYLD